MKLATDTVENTSNLKVKKKIMMGMAPEAAGILIDSLIQIYDDPAVATLREYSSNAVDATLEAGTSLPVQVTLPNALSSKLVIQDFGTGMDEETFENYLQFGWSSKRDSNDAIGGFGLGSKVGLALTSQYTVQTIKDGVKITAIIGRDDNGFPHAQVISVKETSEVNGTRIELPSTDVYKLETAVFDGGFFDFMPSGLIEVNGRPVGGKLEGTSVRELDGIGWWATDPSLSGASIAGVKYDIQWNRVDNLPDGFWSLRQHGYLNGIVVNIDNGSVQITRSRDSLSYTKGTQKVLREVAQKIADGAQELAQEELDKKTTFRDAMMFAADQHRRGINRSALTWKGEHINANRPFYTEDELEKWVITTQDDDGSDITSQLIPHVARLSGYRSNGDIRSNISVLTGGFGGFGSVDLDRLAQDEDMILVYGAKQDKKKHDINDFYRRSFKLRYNDAQANDRTETIYVTLADKDGIPENIRSLFKEIVSAEDYEVDIVRLRAEHLKRIKDAKAQGIDLDFTPTRVDFRKVTISSDYNNYRVYLQAMDSDDLSLTEKHVLLRRSDSEDAKVINTFPMHSVTDARVVRAVQAGVKVLVLNKSYKEGTFPDELEVIDLDDVEQIAQDKASEELSKLTDAQLRILLFGDTRNNVYNLAEIYRTGKIENPDTVDWIKDYVSNPPTVNVTLLAKLVWEETDDKTKIVGQRASKMQNFEQRYPLIDSLVFYRNSDTYKQAAEYINAIDFYNENH